MGESELRESESHPPFHGDGTDRDATILGECRAPITLKQMIDRTGLPKSTLHRRLKKLHGLGWVDREGNAWRTSRKGEEVLEGEAKAEQDPSVLESQWPFLSFFPTPAHRAMAILILCAHIARRDNLMEDRHPGFILLGPTQRLKSWLAKAVCHLAGSEPEKCRVPMMTVRGKGLIARLDSAGRKIYESNVLKEPILWGEELSLADPTVRRDVEAIIHGPKEIRVENESVNIEVVPVFELNPRKKKGNLEDQIGLDIPRLRRCVVVDFSKVRVTRKQKSESGTFLNRIKDASPASLPSAPREPLIEAAQSFVESAFSSCVIPDRLDYTDPSRILTLIVGARALVPDHGEAARMVLECFFTVAETTEYVRPDWRQRLAALKVPDSGEAEEKPAVAGQDESRFEDSSGNSFIPIPYNLDQIVLRLKADLEDLGFHLPEDADRVKGIARIARALKSENISPELFEKIAITAGRFLDLKGLIRNLGATEGRVREILRMSDYLDQKGLKPEEAKGFLDYHLKLQGLGFTWESAMTLAETLGDTDGDAREGSELLLHLAKDGVRIEKKIALLKKESALIQGKRNTLEGEVSQAQKEKTKAVGEWRKVSKTLNRGRSQLQWVRREFERVCKEGTSINSAVNREERRLGLMQEELATLREELVETRAEGNLSAAFLLTLFPGDSDLAFSRNVLGDFEELFRLRQKSPLLFEVRKMDFWGKVAEIEGKLKAHLEGQGETKNISCGPTDPTSGVVSDKRLDRQSL